MDDFFFVFLLPDLRTKLAYSTEKVRKKATDHGDEGPRTSVYS